MSCSLYRRLYLYRCQFPALTLSLVFFLFFSVIHCANDNPRASTPCEAPIQDGAIHELASSCRALQEAHIRIDGISITKSSQSLSLWAKAKDSSGANGIRFYIDHEKIEYTNLDDMPATNTFDALHGGLDQQLLCFELHYDEGPPIHVISWKGSFCDTRSLFHFVFNTNSMTGDDIKAQNKYLYRIDGANLTGKIRTGRRQVSH